jgi:hypothetical protein
MRQILLLTVLLSIFGTCFFLWAAPWGALECGADEGMEFSKIRLIFQRPDLVSLAWNDQPWLYSQVFASIFNLTGFHAVIPRLATFLISLGMLLSFGRLMPKGAGNLHILCSWAFFFCFADMVNLSVSAMLEMPAFGLATISAALVSQKSSNWSLMRFGCAGILFAFALQTKLTAAIVLPAAAAQVAVLWFDRSASPNQEGQLPFTLSNKKKLLIFPIFGLCIFCVTSVLVALWSPGWDWALLIGNHMAASAAPQAAKLRFEPTTLLASPGTLGGALLCLVILWRRRRLPEAIYPIVLFATVLLIHIYHRPWWDYYQIHFAVPLAILGGWGAGELIRLANNKFNDFGSMRSVFLCRDNAMMLGCLVIALWAGFELPRGYNNMVLLKQGIRIADSDEVKLLGEYKQQTKWAYTRLSNLTAQSGLMLPPELTILPKKRFWTKEATEKSVLEIVKQYQCEVLILMPNVELKQKQWNEFVAKEYVNVWSDQYEAIFIAKRLNPKLPISREDALKRFGI